MLPGHELKEPVPVEQRLKWVTWIRLGIMVVLALSTIIAFSDSRTASPLILLLSSAATAVASALYLVWLRTGRGLNLLGAVQIAGDLLLWCVVIYLTGGASSTFSILLQLSVIVAAFLYGARGAMATAGAAAALFVLVSVVMYTQVLAPPSDQAAMPFIERRELIYFLVVNIAGLALVGALSGYLAERERRAGGELEEARRVTQDLAALNDDIVRSLTVGMAATDLEGQVLWMSPAGAEILDRPASEILGTAIDDLICLDEPLPPSQVITGETELSLPDGSVRSLAYRLTALVDGRGAAKGSLLVFQDQTHLIQMQQKVERAERLAELGRLAAGLAHELRNPLGSISGSLEIIRESVDLSEEDQHLLSIVLRELDRLADLVSQMLDLARPHPPEPTETDLVPLIREVARVISASAEAEELSFDIDLPEELVAEIDPRQVRQLVWNLLRNAAQASPPESVVRVLLHRTAEEVVIEVNDSGPGISDEEQRRIFEPFYSTKRGGIGMGLAICQQVVQGHGGKLTVRPAEGQGSSFRAILPLRATPGSVPPPPSPIPGASRRGSFLP